MELLRAGSSIGASISGGRVFSLDRDPTQEQAVLVVRDDHGDAPPRTLVDLVLGGDLTAAVDWYEPSPDGRLVAYGTSSGGDERSTLRVLDAGTGEHLSDVIANTRAASVGWLTDGSAFAYTRYPDPEEVGDEVADVLAFLSWQLEMDG